MGPIVRASTLTSIGLDVSTIRRYCHMKGSPFYQEKYGGVWKVDMSKLDRWLDELAKKKGEKNG